MNVIGMGIDIVETKRIAESLSRFGDKFLERVFCADEIAYARGMKFPEPHLAARFAAKEAVSKAFGTGIGEQMNWLDIEVIRDASGAPKIQLHGNAEAHARARGVAAIHVSLTHTDAYGAASALVLGQ